MNFFWQSAAREFKRGTTSCELSDHPRLQYMQGRCVFNIRSGIETPMQCHADTVSRGWLRLVKIENVSLRKI